jgi:transcriptional regulator NrdR family protein
MNCPECGASGRGVVKVISTRVSHEVAMTRVRKCSACSALSYSVEIPVDQGHVYCKTHYHTRKSVVQRLISALYS